MRVSKQHHLWSCLLGMTIFFLIFHTYHSATPYYLFFYLLFDFIVFYPLFSKDMIVHHILTMLLLTGYDKYEVNDSNKLLSMEVSTPFLVLYKMGVWKRVTKLLFLMTFVYFRIFQVGQVAHTYRHDVMDVHIWLVYALWLLNWHWMLTIIGHFRNEKRMVKVLDAVVPYTHFFSVVASRGSVQWVCLLSAISSFAWHTTKTPTALKLDRCFLHVWSWWMSVCHTNLSPLVLASLPFHLGVMTVKHYRELTLVSIGWDVLLIFLHQLNLMWLAGWVIAGMMYVREVVGAQVLVHSSVAYAISHLRS